MIFLLIAAGVVLLNFVIFFILLRNNAKANIRDLNDERKHWDEKK